MLKELTKYYFSGITFIMQAKTQKKNHLTIKGQITVPKAMRDAMGWTTRTDLAFRQEKDGIKIIARKEKEDPGEALVRRSLGIAKGGMTTDEIMAMTRGED